MRPRFFRQLVDLRNEVQQARNHSQSLVAQITRTNSTDYRKLETIVQDLDSTLLEALSLIREAKIQEVLTRNGVRHENQT